MRSFIAAVARIMSAMTKATGRWIRRAGEWFYEMLPSGGGSAAPMAMEPELQVVATQESDQQVANLRAVAAMMAADKIPDPSLTGRLSDLELRWLCTCDRAMLTSIVRADDKAVRDHVAGRKSIRGVVAHDEAVIAALENAIHATPSMKKAKAELQEMLDGLEPVPSQAY
jgi:hypothetical protein